MDFSRIWKIEKNVNVGNLVRVDLAAKLLVYINKYRKSSRGIPQPVLGYMYTQTGQRRRTVIKSVRRPSANQLGRERTTSAENLERELCRLRGCIVLRRLDGRLGVD